MNDWIEQRDDAVRIRIRVQPRASRTEVVGEHDGALRIRVAAPPVDGEANEALTRFLARRLNVARSRIRLVKGVGSRTKLIEVGGMTTGQVRPLLLGV